MSYQRRDIQKFDQLINKNKVTQSATNKKDKKKRVINKTSIQLTHTETDLFARGLNFSITSKTLPNKDIIAITEYAVQNLEKEAADTICPKLRLTLQNSKPSNENFSKHFLI